jgi:hypothetical protein
MVGYVLDRGFITDLIYGSNGNDAVPGIESIDKEPSKRDEVRHFFNLFFDLLPPILIAKYTQTIQSHHSPNL